MDKEYLEDYQAKEREEYDKQVMKKIEKGTFDFSRDKYPADNRFVKINRPVTDCTAFFCYAEDRWDQVPYSGSTIIPIEANPSSVFEKFYFKVSEIPELIDFIKETGKIQIALQDEPTLYEGLDYLDPFFKELNPPHIKGAPHLEIIGSEKEIQNKREIFFDLANIWYKNTYFYVFNEAHKNDPYNPLVPKQAFNVYSYLYALLKLRYPVLADKAENMMIDNPLEAAAFFDSVSNFISDPIYNIRYDTLTHSFEEFKIGRKLLGKQTGSKLEFPCEVGRFLTKNLTHAPKGLRACNYLIDNYKDDDLYKIQESLSMAVTENNLDKIIENSEAFSQILENSWNDKKILNRVEGIKSGVPLMIGAIGTLISSTLGGFEGLLSALGFTVGKELFKANVENLDEKISKKYFGSHLVTIYNFKKKYESKIVSDKKI